MKPTRLKVVLLLVATSGMAISCAPKPEVAGEYVSKKPTLLEQMKLAYINGNYRFLYTREGESVLKLEKDSTFSYEENFCKKGKVVSTGKWKVADDVLMLHFTDFPGKKDIQFEMLEKQLVLVQDVVMSETKTHINNLTLLQRLK